jgi:diadenosine tetraphosphate (Ap4A) HIT family hydrolase
MNHCNFCIKNNSLQGKILTQNEHCYFVESIDPVLTVAGMIIPFRHVENLQELTVEEWVSIKKILDETMSLLAVHEPAGFNVGWNLGEVAGQNVAHVHLHVIGRFSDEPLAGKGIRHALKQTSNLRPSKKQ